MSYLMQLPDSAPEGTYSSPTEVNGVVYVGSYGNNYDGSVYAFNASSGTLLWRYQTAFFVTSKPAVVNGVVYVGSTNGTVYALTA